MQETHKTAKLTLGKLKGNCARHSLAQLRLVGAQEPAWQQEGAVALAWGPQNLPLLSFHTHPKGVCVKGHQPTGSQGLHSVGLPGSRQHPRLPRNTRVGRCGVLVNSQASREKGDRKAIDQSRPGNRG